MEIFVPEFKLMGRKKRLWHPTEGRGQVLSPEGDVLWEDPDWMPNVLTDEGERDMLAVYLAGAANPSKYMCLIDGTTTAPAETSTMAYLGGAAGARETQVPGANGYNRPQALTTDWTDEGLVGGDARFSTSGAGEKTFGPASAAWTFNHAGLVTASTGQTAGSGKFLLYILMSGTTTLAINQYFKYIMRWAQQ